MLSCLRKKKPYLIVAFLSISMLRGMDRSPEAQKEMVPSQLSHEVGIQVGNDPIPICMICREQCQDLERLSCESRKIPHLLCTTCAQEWFKPYDDNQCPLCRSEVVATIAHPDNDKVLRFQYEHFNVLKRLLDEKIRRDDLPAVRSLLRQLDVNDAVNGMGSMPLHRAAEYASAAMIEMLLERGALIDAQNSVGSTPLYLACTHGNEDAVAPLLESGATVNVIGGASGMTPLHVAALSCSLSVINRLCVRGADVTARDAYGRTPLRLAVRAGSGRAVVDLLMQRGGCEQLSIADHDNMTPVDAALREPPRVPELIALLEHGASYRDADLSAITSILGMTHPVVQRILRDREAIALRTCDYANKRRRRED